MESWKVAAPAARTKLVDGQCVARITGRRGVGEAIGAAAGGAGRLETHLARSVSMAGCGL